MTFYILHFYICKLDNVFINPFVLWELFAGPPNGVFFKVLPSWGHFTFTHSPAPVTSAHILLLSFFSNHLMQQKMWSTKGTAQLPPSPQAMLSP